MIRSLSICTVLLMLVRSTSVSAEMDSLLATPGNLWLAALENSSALSAVSASAESADYLFRGSGRLPDPMVRIGYSPAPLETRNGPVDFTATLSQRIPWPGGLSDSREEMSRMSDMASLDETIAALKMRTEITALWSVMHINRGTARLLEEELERLAHLTDLADIRFRSGQTGLSVLLLLENRTAIVRSMLYGAELEFESINAELSSLLGLDDVLLVWSDSLPGVEYFVEGIDSVLEAEDMPVVRRSRAGVLASGAAADASRASLYPSFEVGATWSVIGEPDVEMGAVDPGRDGLSIFAGMSLPLGYSGAGDRSTSARLSSDAAEYMHLQVISDQKALLQRNVNQVLSMVDMYRSYDGTVVPNTQAMYQLAVTDWISGRTGIEDVIVRLGELEEAELEKIRIYSGIVAACARVLEIEGRITEKGEFL
jgi:cobalt-zinc-cadmium efflux system outer membrane protein